MTTEKRIAIGKRIAEARKEAKMTQMMLGNRIDVSQQMIAQFEKGKRQPNEETLKKIADILDVSSAWLLHGGMILTSKKKEIQEKLDVLSTTPYDEENTEEFLKILAEYFPEVDIDGPPVRESKKEDEIIGYYIQLNEEGQKKATEYVKDLTKIDAYSKPDDECPF